MTAPRPRLARLGSPLAVLDLRTAPPPAMTMGSAGAGSGWARAPGSAASRGYDAAWRKRRLQVLDAEPLCRSCAKHGRVTQAVEVHHLEPFASLADPQRLAWGNLAPSCHPCHATATARASNGRG